MKLIDRYISRAILSATGVVALMVGALLVLMLFISQAGDIGKAGYNLGRVLLYMALMMPDRLSLVLPVVSLLGSLLALGALATGSELIVIRSAGVSMRRLAVSVGLAGLALALVAVLLNEVLAPAGLRNAEALRDRALHGKIKQSVAEGLWLRQGNRMFRIKSVLPGGRIDGLDLYQLTGNGRLAEAMSASSARLVGHQLIVKHPRLTKLTLKHASTQAPARLTFAADIDPNLLKLAVTSPDELSSRGLWAYISYLKNNDIDAGDYQLALWRNIVMPFTIATLTIFALPFAFGSLRSAGAGQRLFLGGLIGLLFFLGNEIVASTAPVYGVPAWLAASLPTLSLAAATGVWMRRLS